MFRLSKITDYGIVLLAHLAAEPDDEVLNAREVASHVDLPYPVVSKILKSLARRGLLESHRGSKGGFSLTRPPNQISVAEMIDALEGPIALTDCSSKGCDLEVSCPVRDPWQIINGVVHTALADITLADLLRPGFPKQQNPLRVLYGDAHASGGAGGKKHVE